MSKMKNRSYKSNGANNRGKRNYSSNNGSARRAPGGGGGNASNNRAKYIERAQEALSNGNRVEAETYFQYAEHYGRVAAKNEISATEAKESNINNEETAKNPEKEPEDNKES